MGLIGSFFETFSDQKKHLQQSNRQATNALAQGYTDANSRYDQAATAKDGEYQEATGGNSNDIWIAWKSFDVGDLQATPVIVEHGDVRFKLANERVFELQLGGFGIELVG